MSVHSSGIPNSQRVETRHVSFDGCMGGRTDENGTNKNEVQIHATSWMNLENTMLSEISQTRKDRYCTIILFEISRIGKFLENGH